MNWRDYVLKYFIPDVARLTLVADPDKLLSEERMLEAIRARGFDLISFEDHVAFRYAYESTYRSHWDLGESTDLVVVLRTDTNELEQLPYDLLQGSRKLAFSLGELFPQLSYQVVASLEKSDLQILFQAQQQYNPGHLGVNASKDFVLRHVFEMAPEMIKSDSDLLRVLLRRHYRQQNIPSQLDQRFIQVVRQSGRFNDWPLEQIITEREAFFLFLQERWLLFLDHLSTKETGIGETKGRYQMFYSGPETIPFDHDDVKVYIDNLFVEGYLQPIAYGGPIPVAQAWVKSGIQNDRAKHQHQRVKNLLSIVNEKLPGTEAKYQDWLAFAPLWAQLKKLINSGEAIIDDEAIESYIALQLSMDTEFSQWLTNRYSGLYNQASSSPVMVHHIPRNIARKTVENGEKAALIVVDGLAFDQWLVLSEVLESQLPGLKISEEAIFAWVPTLTSLSRQAIFSGRMPLYFPDSINSTDKEAKLWERFWSDQGLTPARVAYKKGLGESEDLISLETLLVGSSIQVVGLVVDKVDKIMHGMQLGSKGMHNQTRQWVENGLLKDIIQFLLDQGFRIYLTSDHGNIEADGIGNPGEASVADLRGQRARIYSDQVLRAMAKEKVPEAFEWPPIGLPQNYLPLLAPARAAFITRGERMVVHGGASMEEIIVPFVRIGWK